MKDYKEAIESIMKDTTSKVIEHAINAYHQGLSKAQTDSYVKGYEDGKADTPFTDTEEAEKRAYEDGMNLAWECARKMCLMSSEERLRAFDVSGNHLAILSDLTASKAIEKLKAFEQKQKCKECKKTKDPIFYGHCVGECDYAKQTEDEIKVGDEIRLHDAIEVVTSVMRTGLQTIDANGNTSTWYYDTYSLEKWEKTGRHFPQIIEVLAELRGER